MHATELIAVNRLKESAELEVMRSHPMGTNNG